MSETDLVFNVANGFDVTVHPLLMDDSEFRELVGETLEPLLRLAKMGHIRAASVCTTFTHHDTRWVIKLNM